MIRNSEQAGQPSGSSGFHWVVLADSSPIVASGLRVFFDETIFRLIERVSLIGELRRVLENHEVDVVISDLAIDDAQLDDLIELCQQHRKPHLLFSTNSNPGYLGQAWRAGVAGWISKSASRAEILKGLSMLIEGNQLWTRRQTRQIIGSLVATELAEKPDFPLTDRELEILRLVAAGNSNQGIADKLHIGFETVKEHVQRLLAKIGVNDRTQAAVHAERNDVL